MFGFTQRAFTDHTFAEFLREHKAIDNCTRVGNSNQWRGPDNSVVAVAVYEGNGGMNVTYWVRSDLPQTNEKVTDMPRKAKIGSISSGTLLPADLIPAFANELRALRGSLPKELHRRVRSFKSPKFTDSDRGELVIELENTLADFAPPYCYFGAHPGDGADFGFWLFEDFLQSARDDGALEVSDTSEVPENYSGEVLHVNDHGNATLYNARKGKLTEVWSVV